MTYNRSAASSGPAWLEDYDKWEDVLKRFHEQNGEKASIITECLQLPQEDNGWMAIFKATAITTKGEFVAHGEATKQADGATFFRKAETRARRRAVSSAVGIDPDTDFYYEGSEASGGHATPTPTSSIVRRPVPEREPVAQESTMQKEDKEIYRSIVLKATQLATKRKHVEEDGVSVDTAPVVAEVKRRFNLPGKVSEADSETLARIHEWLSNQLLETESASV